MAFSPRPPPATPGRPEQSPAATKRFSPVVPPEKLQQLLDRAKSSGQSADASAFRTAMQQELKSFDEYATMTYNVFHQRVFAIIKSFGMPQLNPKAAEADCDQLAAGIIEFNALIGTQFRFYKKLLVKFEKATGGDVSNAEALLLNLPFARIGFGDLVTMLSDIYHSIRGLLKLYPPRPDPTAIDSKTYKYFVRLEDIVKLKLAIAKYMPVLRPGRQQGVVFGEGVDGRRFSGFQHLNNGYDGGGEGDGMYQTVIFLENDSLDMYHDKVQKKGSSDEIKIRWDGEEGGPCIVEVQSAHSSLLQSANLKERFELPYNRVGDFLAGRLTAQQYVDGLKSLPEFNAKTLREIQSLAEMVQSKIKKDEIEPALRTIFHRTTFQFNDFAAIKIYIDTTTHISLEPEDPGKGRWCRDLSKPIPPGDALMFPLGCVEIKTYGLPQLPPWLNKLLQAGYLVDAGKFSKFVHGMAALQPSKIKVLPPWFKLPFVHLPGQPLVNWYCAPPMTLDATDENYADVAKFAKPMRTGKSSRYTEEELSPIRKAPDISGAKKPDAPRPAPTSLPPPVPKPDAAKDEKKKDKDTGDVKPNVPVATSPPVWSKKDGGGIGMIDENQSFFDKIREFLFKIRVAKGRGGLTPLLHAMRIEPKTWFANERTLLGWIRRSIWLALAGAALYQIRTQAVTVVFVLAVAVMSLSILFLVYAFGTYAWRRRGFITRKNGHWNDSIGPTVLIVLIIAYFVALLVSRYILSPAAEPGYIPPLVVLRSYQVPVLLASLTSGGPNAILDDLRQAAAGFTITGSFSQTYSSVQTWYDNTPSCVLFRNGYRLRQDETVDSAGLQAFSTTLSFDWPDSATMQILDGARGPSSPYNATEVITPPDQYLQTRYSTLSIPRTLLPRANSMSNYYPAFTLINFIPPELSNATLTWVNSVSLNYEKWAGPEVSLSHPYRTAKIGLEIWRSAGSVFYSMLRVEIIWQETIDLLLPAELSKGLELYHAMTQRMTTVNGTQPADVIPFVYGSWCP